MIRANYTAPEQINGVPVDGRADQYALACAAFEMLTGEPPFQRDEMTAVIWAHLAAPPPQLTARRPDLSAAADQVFARALSKAPAHRYDRCADFADALRASLGLDPYHSGPGVLPPPTRRVSDHPGTRVVRPADDDAQDAIRVIAAPAGEPPKLTAQNGDVNKGTGLPGITSPGDLIVRPAPPESITQAVLLMYFGAALPFIAGLVGYPIFLASR